MIDKKYRRKDLIGRKCRPVRDIQNGGGDGISSSTICTIVDVVRGHGFKIKTDKCPCCGQYAYITGISREDLELIDDSELKEDYSTFEPFDELYCIESSRKIILPCYFSRIVYFEDNTTMIGVWYDDESYDEFDTNELGVTLFRNWDNALKALKAIK